MRSKSSRLLLLAATAVSLAACSGQDLRDDPAEPIYKTSLQSEVDQQIAQSSADAAHALQTLAMIQRARTEPAPSTIDETAMPPELIRPTTLSWSGPSNELVRAIAKEIGYSFIETGAAPTNPTMVSVDLNGISAAKALEDVGLRIQAYASIIVNPNTKRIEYRNENTPMRQGPVERSHGPAHGHRPHARPAH